MAHRALLIAKHFACICGSWYFSRWVLEGPLENLKGNLHDVGTSVTLEKSDEASLIRGIVTFLEQEHLIFGSSAVCSINATNTPCGC